MVYEDVGNFVEVDGRPQAVKNYLTYSLRRLGTDYVDVYRPGRLDPMVPIEDTVGAIAEMVQAGYVRAIGLLTGAWTPHESNLKLVEALHKLAGARGATAAQLAIAWVLAQGRERGDIVAVVGSRTRQQLAESLPRGLGGSTDRED